MFIKDGKKVTIRKNIREKGKKIADKNWVLTAYDLSASDGSSAITTTNQGEAAPATDKSASKDTAKTSDSQEDEKKRTEKDKGKGKKNERKAKPMDIGKFVPYAPNAAEWVQDMPPMANRLGVYHDPSGFAVATDGHILVYDKRQYDGIARDRL